MTALERLKSIEPEKENGTNQKRSALDRLRSAQTTDGLGKEAGARSVSQPSAQLSGAATTVPELKMPKLTVYDDTDTFSGIMNRQSAAQQPEKKKSALVNTLTGAAKSEAAGFTNAGGVTLDLVRAADMRLSEHNQKAGQEAKNAVHYREMAARGTMDDGTVLDDAGKQRLLELAKQAEKRAGIYQEANEADHKPITDVAQRTYDKADALADSAAKDIQAAKEGKGALGSFMVDAGVAGAQMLGDMAASMLVPGAGMAMMAGRSFGSGAQEARRSGATLGQAAAYGAGSAALGMATEKIANVAAPFTKTFGKGVLDQAIAKATGKLGQTAAGRIALSALSEGAEEFVEDIFQPVLQRATYNKDARFDLGEALYDAAVGGLLGGLGGVAENVGKSMAMRPAAEITEEGMRLTGAEMDDTSVNDDPGQHSTEEMKRINDYKASTDLSLAGWIDRVKTAFSNGDQSARKMKKVLGDVSVRTAEMVSKETGVDVAGYRHMIDGSAVQHIEERHGAHGKADSSMALTDDLARVQYVIENADSASLTKDENGVLRLSKQYRDKNNMPARMVTFAKKIDGTYYAVEAVPDAADKTLHIVSAYMQKNSGNIIQALNMEEKSSPQLTPEAPHGSVVPAEAGETLLHNSTLSQAGDSVKNTAVPSIDPQLTDEHGVPVQILERLENGEHIDQSVLTNEQFQALAEREGMRVDDQLRVYKEKETAPEAAQRDAYLDALAQEQNAPAVEKLNQPTRAKKDLRQDILNLYSVPAGRRAEMGKAIELAGEELLKSGRLTEETRASMLEALYDAGVVVQDADPAYKAVRDDLKGRRIYVDPTTKAELGDDWNSLRAKAMGNGFYLTTDETVGTGVDMIQQELAENLGHGMFDESMAASDALRQIIDIAEAGKPAHISLAEDAERLRQEYGGTVADDQVDNLVRQTDEALRRFAEKAGLEIDLKDRADTMVEKERQRWRDMLDRQSARKRQSEAAKTTQRNLRYLRKRLGYNDSRLAEALHSMNESDRAVAEAALQNIETDTLRLTEEAKARIEDNAKRYEQMLASDPNYIPDKKTLALLEKMDREYLANKSVDELLDINKAVQTLRTHLANMNEIIGKERREKIESLYQIAKGEIQSSKGRKGEKNFTGVKGKALDFMESQLTPMNRMEMMGGWKENGAWYSFAKELEAGERGKKQFTVEANKIFEDFRKEHADWIAKSDGQGKDAIWYEIEVPELLGFDAGDKPMFGDTIKVKLTPAMKVELARAARSYDNLRHAEGGVTFPDADLYSKGKRKEAYGQGGTTIKLAPETMKKLFSFDSLTAEEKELYRLGDKFFDEMAKKAINETSQQLDGVDRAISDHYSKIYTNSSYRMTDATKIDQSIGGMGSLQKRVQSKAPMLAMSMWEAYSDTVDTVGKYANLSIPTRNLDMIFNWMEKGRSASMKDVLEKQWGDGATKYVEDLLTTMQNRQGVEKTGLDQLTDALLSNYVTATFGLNPGIVLKQATSFPSAASVLGFDTVPSVAQLRNIDTDLIAKYSPELEYRSMGYATPELAELRNNPNWTQRNKVTRFLFGGAIQAMDRATVSAMWPWAENAVKKTHPELKEGSDAYYKKTAELFEKAVSETQPMYDEMHRADIMKGETGITRAFTMFKTVPLQQQNMIRKAWNEAKATGSDEAKKKLRRTAASLIVATLGYESVEFANQLWKNRAKNYRDDEEELTAESTAKAIAQNSVKDLAGIVVGGQELADVLMSAWNGTRYYETEMPGLAQLNELLGAVENTAKTVKTLGDDTKDLLENGGSIRQYAADNSEELLGYVKETAELLSEYAAGVPVSNLEKYILGTIQWTSPELKEAYEAIWEDTTKRDLSGLTGDALRVRVSDLMDARASGITRESKEELARIYEEMGTEVIPTDVPTSLSVDGESVKLTATMKQAYKKAYADVIEEQLNDLLASTEYRTKATNRRRADAITMLYSYAKGKAAEAAAGKPLEGGAEKAEKIVAAGGSLSDYIWYATMAPSTAAEAVKYLDSSAISETGKVAIYMNAVASDEKREQQADLQKKYGITQRDYYRYAVESAGASKKAEKVAALANAGISTEKQADFYFEVIASEAEQKAQESAAEQGVSKDIYYQYIAASQGMTKKAEKLDAINGLDISVAQKNALYFANGYAQSTLYDAPWYDLRPRLSSNLKLPDLKLPELKLSEIPDITPRLTW
ncbi:MAG: hypothetical protein MJ074_06760 [Oscillospiraceae bacterium]|nr:hypothetical protein [Oscillospiraceae bacterium]